MGGFYAYEGNQELGKEPLGTFGKFMWHGKTERGAIRACKERFGQKPFRLYRYTNFFDNSTFREVAIPWRSVL